MCEPIFSEAGTWACGKYEKGMRKCYSTHGDVHLDIFQWVTCMDREDIKRYKNLEQDLCNESRYKGYMYCWYPCSGDYGGLDIYTRYNRRAHPNCRCNPEFDIRTTTTKGDI